MHLAKHSGRLCHSGGMCRPHTKILIHHLHISHLAHSDIFINFLLGSWWSRTVKPLCSVRAWWSSKLKSDKEHAIYGAVLAKCKYLLWCWKSVKNIDTALMFMRHGAGASYETGRPTEVSWSSPLTCLRLQTFLFTLVGYEGNLGAVSHMPNIFQTFRLKTGIFQTNKSAAN